MPLPLASLPLALLRKNISGFVLREFFFKIFLFIYVFAFSVFAPWRFCVKTSLALFCVKSFKDFPLYLCLCL
jgi:hypothetical protein